LYSRDNGDGGASSKLIQCRDSDECGAVDGEDGTEAYEGKRVNAPTANITPSDYISMIGEESQSEPSNEDVHSCDESELLGESDSDF
jgi:hypothetical protein